MTSDTSSASQVIYRKNEPSDLRTASDLIHYLESAGFEMSVPINVDEIAKALSINIVYDFNGIKDDFVGKIEFGVNNWPVVTLNPIENTYEPRRRFTIAHEIGHYCLHSNQHRRFIDTRKNMSRTGSYWDTYEYEANAFAAELLMPES